MSRKRKMLFLTLALFGVAVLATLAVRLGVPLFCPFFQITGLQCPGCGNSRAVMSLLRGDWGGLVRYNPLFLPEMLYIGWVYLSAVRNYLRGGRFSYHSPSPWLDGTVLAAVLAWGILRNIL